MNLIDAATLRELRRLFGDFIRGVATVDTPPPQPLHVSRPPDVPRR